MQYENFKRIVNTFADEDGGVIIEKGRLLMSIRGRDVEAEIREGGDGIIVIHDESEWMAEKWIRTYLARLDFLADRIIRHVDPPDHYVSPSGKLLDWYNNSNDCKFSDAKNEILSKLGVRAAGTTTVYYLTSDAGEGKTSLIEQIAVEQANKFKDKKATSLILPVPLGGRSFLRFDDAVIALLSNSLRFQFLYYDSFIELVKMGAIIPAFDGYEEMLSETESGEAVSAIGHLIEQLSSTGTILVSVRRGYYESSLRSDSRLVDSVRFDHRLETHHFALDRWNRDVFREYATKRNIPEPDKLYERVKSRLGMDDHPVLTRAILVSRLIDVAEEEKGSSELNRLLDRIERSQTNFFFDFVEGIVDREVKHKWIDQSGREMSPLLKLDEHHELLSQLSFEMWVNSVTSLDFDTVQLVVKVFVEEKKMRPDLSRKICKRINDHALLRQDPANGNRRVGYVRFDHEDFQDFYLGQSLARALSRGDCSTARLILDVRSLAPLVINEAARYLVDPRTNTLSIDHLLTYIHDLLDGKWYISYIHENCAALMLELSENSKGPHSMQDLNFPVNLLYQRKLKNLKITKSFFNNTSLAESELINCIFQECRFAELSIDNVKELGGTVFDRCTFDSVVIGENSEEGPRVFFDRQKINSILQTRGFHLNTNTQAESNSVGVGLIDIDDDLKLTLKFMRMYHRATAIHEGEISKRIGKRSNYFFKKILPALENARLIDSIEKSNKKFRLLIPLSDVDRLVDNSGTTFKQFIQEASVQEFPHATTSY